MTSPTSRAVLVLLGLATLAVETAAAPRARRPAVIDLGTLPGDYFSSASDINHRGQVVGWSLGPSGQFRAFIWEEGVMTELPLLAGARFASASAINERGQIVGASGDAFSRAALWNDGEVIDLGQLPGATGCFALAINNRGQIAGTCDLATGGPGAFLWDDGHMIALGTLPGGGFTYASAINNDGAVVGGALTATGEYHAFAWRKGEIADLGTLPGGFNSMAGGINDRGTVVGSSDTGSFEPLAVLWNHGPAVSLGTLPGETWSQGIAINHRGQVVGRSGQRPFLWDDGAMEELTTLQGGTGIGFAINNRGDIAGEAENADGQPRAVIWTERGLPLRDRTIVWDFGPETGLLTPPEGAGAVLFSASNNQNFVEAVSFRRDTAITGLNVFTSSSHLPLLGTHFRVKILTDDGGVPGAPLRVFDVAPTSVTFAGMFPTAGGQMTDVHRVSLRFAPIELQGGATHWVGASGLDFDAGTYGVLGAGDGLMMMFSGDTLVGPAPPFFGDLMFQLSTRTVP